MKLEISRKMLTFGLIGLVVIIVLSLAVIRYRSRSKFEWPVTTPGADDTQLKTDLQALQDTYNTTMITVNAMPAGQTKTDAIIAAEKTLTEGINNKVSSYVSNKCPDVSTGVAPTDATKVSFWNTYQADLASIQNAYYTILGSTAATPTNTQILAARKADFSGATRKYIASICPSFYYKSASDDPTGTYKTWTYQETTAPTTPGLLKGDVTGPNITAWADYVAVTSNTLTTVSVSQGASTIGPISVTNNGLVVGDKIQYTYQTVNQATGATTTAPPVMGTIATLTGTNITITPTTAVPAGGYIIPAGTILAKALVPASTKWNLLDGSSVPNWKKARDYGPASYPKPTWAT